jgi:hypothetical protein
MAVTILRGASDEALLVDEAGRTELETTTN